MPESVLFGHSSGDLHLPPKRLDKCWRVRATVLPGAAGDLPQSHQFKILVGTLDDRDALKRLGAYERNLG